jgi:hypothetical protein
MEDHSPSFPEIVELGASMGNQDLENMKLHSFEAGWQGRFLDDSLQLNVDLFYSLYRDTIGFIPDIPVRMGFPVLSQAKISFENGVYDADAMGGEIHLSWNAFAEWTFWCNLGLRRVEYLDEEITEFEKEPTTRINAGIRYLPATGIFMDVAVHYVSSYVRTLDNPDNMLSSRTTQKLGDNYLLIGRLGYRLPFLEKQVLEAGLLVRTPLGLPFREYAGVPMPKDLQEKSAADFGGDYMARQVSAYLRSWF